MNIKSTRLVYALLAFIAPFFVLAQNGNRFSLNISNGLPSNHIYSTIIDKHGYLWIATDNGVIRYNGYELRTFTTEDGLPVNDVWQLLEDDKGKIWLGCIADRVGYIYNERYYSAKFADTTYHTIYPINMTKASGQIMFLTSYLKGNLVASLCMEKDDVIHNYSLADATIASIPQYESSASESLMLPFINSYGNCFGILKNTIYKFTIKDQKITAIKLSKNDSLQLLLKQNTRLFEGNFIFIYNKKGKDPIRAIDIFTGNTTYINVKGKILNLYPSMIHDTCFISIAYSNEILNYKVSPSAVDYVNTDPIEEYITTANASLENTSIFQRNAYWGNCLSSEGNNGLLIQYNPIDIFHLQEKYSLSNYEYNGSTKSGEALWLNSATQRGYIIDENLHFTPIKAESNTTSKNFGSIDDNCIHISNVNRFFNVKTHKVCQLNTNEFALNKYFILPEDPKLWICMSNFGIQKIDPELGLKSAVYIDTDRYKNIVYDSNRNAIWTYNQNKLMIYKDRRKSLFIRSQLLQFGIDRIEKIAFDKRFGNVFLKSNDKMTLYDYEKRTYKELFNQINLKECSFEVVSDMLVVYGRFGVLFCKIAGKGSLSTPIIYPNIKNTYYNHIYDVQSGAGKMLLNTDRGVYFIAVPSRDFTFAGENKIAEPSRIVYYYKSQIQDLNTGDTILLSQDDLRIRFDLINPLGNGLLRYNIQLPAKSFDLNSNEYIMSAATAIPGNYINISLSAYDNVWRSKPIRITLYITPYWWQTRTMQRIIWISASILVIALFAGAILITRRLVLNASKKRNLRMEMELKAIYSQINPHFIFNSLNSALLLVSKNKMDEAYVHISKFSRLLRSYIKSSRNKFITAQEEIINLQNYIELQQIRFKDRFSYEINTEKLTNRGVKIPALLLQPFVENAIEHGLLNNLNKGHLSVNFSMTNDNTLVCTIDDNGIGREEAKIISGLNVSKEESYGNLLIKDLVKIFNKYENVNVDIAYIDKTPPASGTTVTITIKYLT